MSTIKIPRVHAATLLKPMSSGRTKPCLMLCTDDSGKTYEAVIKWRGAKEMSAQGLVCELMTALLALDLDLPVPKPFIIEVAPNFNVGESKPELAAIAQKSAGLNFGCERLPAGVITWPKDKPIPILMRPLAAEIFAFDLMTQNPDRRRESPNGPNLLWAGDEIYLYDHEQAFSFLAGVIGWQPPWTGQGNGFCKNHVFFQQLAGNQYNFDRLSGALEALTDARLNEYVDAVPNEWRSNNKAAEEITGYLRKARQNRVALFGVANHLLS